MLFLLRIPIKIRICVVTISVAFLMVNYNFLTSQVKDVVRPLTWDDNVVMKLLTRVFRKASLVLPLLTSSWPPGRLTGGGAGQCPWCAPQALGRCCLPVPPASTCLLPAFPIFGVIARASMSDSWSVEKWEWREACGSPMPRLWVTERTCGMQHDREPSCFQWPHPQPDSLLLVPVGALPGRGGAGPAHRVRARRSRRGALSCLAGSPPAPPRERSPLVEAGRVPASGACPVEGSPGALDQTST